MSVSVLCPVRNGARYLAEALASALAQTLPADEVVVVDDGSSDDSAAIAESFAGVRVVRTGRRGVAAARNTLVAEARGDLVAFLDADDTWTPDKLAIQVAYMDGNPAVGVSFTHQRVHLEAGVERPRWLPREALDTPTPIVATCAMVARRALFASVGAFDETLVRGEDTDWLFRAVAAGAGYVILPDALLVRRVHADNLTHGSPGWRSELFGHLRRAVQRNRR